MQAFGEADTRRDRYICLPASNYKADPQGKLWLVEPGYTVGRQGGVTAHRGESLGGITDRTSGRTCGRKPGQARRPRGSRATQDSGSPAGGRHLQGVIGLLGRLDA